MTNQGTLQFSSNEIVDLIKFHLCLVLLLKVTCLLLGFFVVWMGYRLILSGAKGEFKFSGKFLQFDADLVSVSPGLLFVLLGVALMAYAVGVQKVSDVRSVQKSKPQN